MPGTSGSVIRSEKTELELTIEMMVERCETLATKYLSLNLARFLEAGLDISTNKEVLFSAYKSASENGNGIFKILTALTA